MEIKEVFEKHIRIEPKVMAIETLFNNQRRLDKTNYKPDYQRNYVWDSEKASYFVESILLGTEIPPLIFFKTNDVIEVIDGRQRYQTILRFINDDFKLSQAGLNRLFDLGNKSFKNLGDLKDLFWDTKLRIIEFSFHDSEMFDQKIQDKVKIEVFKRYNSGITPLRNTEIDKAVYLDDDLNSFFKKKITKDKVLFDQIMDVFSFDKPDIEIILKKVRQLLVLHMMPIRRYAVKKDKAINKFYEFYSGQIIHEAIPAIFESFIFKINYLLQIKKGFKRSKFSSNRLQFECVFWAMQVLELELDSFTFDRKEIYEIVNYLNENKESYSSLRSSFAKELVQRYKTTADFFESKYKIDFNEYLMVTDDFKSFDSEVTEKKIHDNPNISFESLRINKPEPSSVTIEDVIRQMTRQRFHIRPLYQRTEVINKKKSSAIIESIFLGIKIPPIFIFKRKDGVSEVLDGQQRLLSILGFIGEGYLNQNGKMTKSEKNEYSLNLKNGILSDYNGKSYKKLDEQSKEKILEYDLWIIEIDEKNNENFDPVDLFIRLNYKPYPIKENSFEMWNSYIDREIIGGIKELYNLNEEWFYFRKNNSRMDNENMLIGLSYLEYKLSEINANSLLIPDFLEFYKIGDKINFRLRSKNDISKILEEEDSKDAFINSINILKDDFIRKVRLLSTYANKESLGKGFDSLLNIDNNRRTQQSFYALWYFLSNVNLKSVEKNVSYVFSDIKTLFELMQNVEEKEHFEKTVALFWMTHE